MYLTVKGQTYKLNKEQSINFSDNRKHSTSLTYSFNSYSIVTSPRFGKYNIFLKHIFKLG